MAAATFVFNTELGGIGHDTIGDFSPGEDHISLDYSAFNPGTPTGFSDWLASHATAVMAARTCCSISTRTGRIRASRPSC
jgi:hypothetical protein